MDTQINWRPNRAEKIAQKRITKWYGPVRDLLVENFNELTETSDPYDIILLKGDILEVRVRAEDERDKKFWNADGTKIIEELKGMEFVLKTFNTLLKDFESKGTLQLIHVEIPPAPQPTAPAAAPAAAADDDEPAPAADDALAPVPAGRMVLPPEVNVKSNRKIPGLYTDRVINPDPVINLDQTKRNLHLTVKTKNMNEEHRSKEYPGLAVHKVDADGPAHKAGVKAGDFIVKFNDKFINALDLQEQEVNKFNRKLESFDSNAPVKITLIRIIKNPDGGGGKRKKRTIKRKMHHKKTHKKKSKKQNKRSKTYRKRNNKKTHRKY